MLPGGKRTRALNIQATGMRSIVLTAKCGSSRPESWAAMPTFSVVFCAMAGRVASSDAASRAARNMGRLLKDA